jgi:hypothetical protein
MIPLTAKYFASMLFEYLDRDIISNIKQLETAITSSTQYLVGIPLVEADIVCAVWCLPFSEQSHVCIIHLKLFN